MKNAILLFLALTAWASAQPFNVPHYHRTTAALDSGFVAWPSDSIVVWLDATYQTETNGDTARIAYDRSGLQNNFGTSASATTPLWYANVQNGKPAWYFDGSDDRYQRFFRGDSLTGQNTGTWFVVLRYDAASSFGWIHVHEPSPYGMTTHMPYSNGGAYFNHGTAAISNAAWPSYYRANTVLYMMRRTPDSLRLYANDTVRASVASTALFQLSAAGLFTVGANNVDNRYMRGYMMEYILSKKALSPARIEKLVAYLRNKWATP